MAEVLAENQNKNYVVVTGASKGIGRATVEALLAQGVKVIGVSRHKPGDLSNDNLSYVEGDLQTPEGIEGVRKEIESIIGTTRRKIRAIIHCAGSLELDEEIAQNAEKGEAMKRLNADAPLALTKALSDYREEKSPILFAHTLSARETTPGGNMDAYVESKKEGWEKMQKSDFQADVVGVWPGAFKTAMLEKKIQDKKHFPWEWCAVCPEDPKLIASKIAERALQATSDTTTDEVSAPWISDVFTNLPPELQNKLLFLFVWLNGSYIAKEMGITSEMWKANFDYYEGLGERNPYKDLPLYDFVRDHGPLSLQLSGAIIRRVLNVEFLGKIAKGIFSTPQ